MEVRLGRWRAAFANELMRRGVESRVVSMDTELPLEVVLTHTRDELERAVSSLGPGTRHWCSRGSTGSSRRTRIAMRFWRVRDRW